MRPIFLLVLFGNIDLTLYIFSIQEVALTLEGASTYKHSLLYDFVLKVRALNPHTKGAKSSGISSWYTIVFSGKTLNFHAKMRHPYCFNNFLSIRTQCPKH